MNLYEESLVKRIKQCMALLLCPIILSACAGQAPDTVWDKIGKVYESMPYWAGNENGPSWKGEGIDLWASDLNMTGKINL